MQTTEASVGKSETRIEQPNEKLDDLTTETKEASAGAKVDRRTRAVDWKAKRWMMQSKLGELRASGSKRLVRFKGSVKNAWNEVKTAFKELKY